MRLGAKRYFLEHFGAFWSIALIQWLVCCNPPTFAHIWFFPTAVLLHGRELHFCVVCIFYVFWGRPFETVKNSCFLDHFHKQSIFCCFVPFSMPFQVCVFVLRCPNKQKKKLLRVRSWVIYFNGCLFIWMVATFWCCFEFFCILVVLHLRQLKTGFFWHFP